MPLGTSLVVEDGRTTAALIETTLSDEGDHVWVAAGSAAVELAPQSHPDRVLLDWMMPGMDGVQVCTYLRAKPQTATVPIVLIRLPR